jgi:phenylpropionate dioxygenase-like ring-hydroxylating dioxygenase large terminal subunit
MNLMQKTWVPVATWAGLSAATLRPAWLGTTSILLGRDRAFVNRCPHRGARLVDPKRERVASPIVCPYHAISFNAATGEMAKAPRWPDCPPMYRTRLAVAQYGPFALVHEDPGRTLVQNDPVPDEQRARESKMVVRAQAEVSVAAPITIVMENFLDTYHVPVIHKTLARNSRIDRHQHLHSDSIAWHFSTVLDTGTESPMTEAGGTCWFTAVWPSAFAFRLATHVFAVTLRPAGHDDERTVETATLLAPTEWPAEQVKETMAFYMGVNDEDVAVCELVAEGRGYEHGGGASHYHPEYEAYSGEYVDRVEATARRFACRPPPC